jgi:hypothetical protein
MARKQGNVITVSYWRFEKRYLKGLYNWMGGYQHRKRVPLDMQHRYFDGRGEI